MKASLSPDVERLIQEKVSSGRYRSADEVVRLGLSLLQKSEEQAHTAPPGSAGDLAAMFAEIASDVPDTDWQKVPADLSGNLDHYLYGAQKTS
ncbi:ribbon-helix-helix domain-containing protein [Paracidobacterium acidisoli]|uniref:Type II toxin-antitoxin system ParD family antitoxin n=1 Tax=Paracidobacterium acidisoli TaxID=2303751 RepID=A0A372IRK3_9BACT|nr:type II toxin-antitoxin system ParD family antitoxin [Paracidobacterium acidisoli]MBT9330447.1 type II toxin-antitoxin system ParD family antitoxin [Paracidobacterium acidisoli]